MNNLIKYVKKPIMFICAVIMFAAGAAIDVMAAPSPAAGGALGRTALVSGSIRLATDITTILLIASPIVGIAGVIYFQIRKSTADEMDQKKWSDRTSTAIVSVIIAVSASAIIKVVISYVT